MALSRFNPDLHLSSINEKIGVTATPPRNWLRESNAIIKSSDRHLEDTVQTSVPFSFTVAHSVTHTSALTEPPGIPATLFLAALGSAACLAGGGSWANRGAHCLCLLGLCCCSLVPASSPKALPAVTWACWIGVGGTGSEFGYPAVPLRLDLQTGSADEETEAQEPK